MRQKQIINALNALAQENRLMIFRHLVQAGPEGLPAGQIAEQLGLPAATLSFHLKTLKKSGLLRCNRHSRLLVYAADFQVMQALVGYLTENCCAGAVDRCNALMEKNSCLENAHEADAQDTP